MAATCGTKWARRVAFLMLGVGLTTAAVFGLRGPQGLSTLYEKRREIRRLQEENATLMKENEERRERLRRLREDPNLQDEIIRRHLKRAKPGETTLIYPHPPAR